MLFEQGKADGEYRIHAPGCAAALLLWADSLGVLPDWTAFAAVPLDSFGRGKFRFQGGRAIPPEATHICVRTVSDSLMEWEERLFRIPEGFCTKPMEKRIRLCVMSDLHLSAKAGTVRKAFSAASGADALLLAGDVTNDGTPEQYSLLKECIQECLPGTKVFSVVGNHDIPRTTQKSDGVVWDYPSFQKWLLERSGEEYINGPDGAYAVRLEEMELFGIQAVAERQKFFFEEGRQLEWLDRRLSEPYGARWRILLCHAPLLHHNPVRLAGTHNPYLNRDKQLQEIINRHGRILFVSGHTHLSVNDSAGCAEWDKGKKNIYVNAASIRPTDLPLSEWMQPAEWKTGTLLELSINGGNVEITARSVKDGKKHARGYYQILDNVC